MEAILDCWCRQGGLGTLRKAEVRKTYYRWHNLMTMPFCMEASPKAGNFCCVCSGHCSLRGEGFFFLSGPGRELADIGCAANFPSLLMVLLRPLIFCVAALNILRVGIKDGKSKLPERLLLGGSRDAMVCHVDEEGVGQMS